MNKRPAGVYPLFTLLHTFRNFSLYLLTFSSSLSSFLSFFFFIKHLLLLFFLLFLWTEIRSDHYIQMHIKGDYDLFFNFYTLLCIFADYKMKLIVFPFVIRNLNLFAVQIVLCDILCIILEKRYSWSFNGEVHIFRMFSILYIFCVFPFFFCIFFCDDKMKGWKKSNV